MLWWFGFAEENSEDDGYRQIKRPEDEDGVAGVGEEVGDVLTTVIPWGISILLHAGMVLLAIFIVWSTIKTVPEEEIIIPIAQLSATPGAPLTTQQTTQKETTRTTTSRSRSLSRSTSTSMSQSTSLSSSASTSESSLIGLAGGGGGGGGKGNPFGSSMRDVGSFKATFFGTGGNAKNLVYCLDASGSLIDTLPFVIQELKRSIGELSEQQKFTVVFFQGQEANEVKQPRPGLKRATGETKKAVFAYIDPKAGNVVPGGATNPVKAIQLALRMKPDLIFLLSDNITGRGRWAVDQRRLLREIDEANKSKTKLNTIQFIYPDPLVEYGYKPTMQMIAEQHGGIYKFVNARELGIGTPPAMLR